MPDFPLGHWDGRPLRFVASLPAQAPEADFVLVFAWQGNSVLLAKIASRGWCVPSGKVEPGESAEAAAIRELQEETGAEATSCVRIGRFLVEDGAGTKTGDAFVANGIKLGMIPAGSESQAVKFVDLADLPNEYFEWNDLFAATFAYSREFKEP